MITRLKIGVIGAGVFGNYHAQKCASHPRIEFVGIYDPNTDKVKQASIVYTAKAFHRADKLFAAVDAVIIACPAKHHASMALQALDAGCHCLIEKPLASNYGQGQDIIARAAAKNLIVQVGHQERLVMKAIGLDRVPEMPKHITCRRMSPYSPRCTDVSVTLDLMTHDIDLLYMLSGSIIKNITSETGMVRSDTADMSHAKIEFENGMTARLEASRAAEKSHRSMSITYPSGQVEIDFNQKTVTHNTPFNLDRNFAQNPRAKDSLGAATNAFVESVLGGKPVIVTGTDGLNALHAALIIDGVLPLEA